MKRLGGFPEYLLVRKEMLMVWGILLKDRLQGRPRRWVMEGSYGVGKSALLLLHCFHLAQSHNLPVFLARKLGSDADRTEEGVRGLVAICIFPGGRALGYPVLPKYSDDLRDVYRGFMNQYRGKGHGGCIVALDGWTEPEFRFDNAFDSALGYFHYFVTSENCRHKSFDQVPVVCLFAWHERQLKKLWKVRNMNKNEFKYRYFYSGGSVRDLFREQVELDHRVKSKKL